MSAERSNHEKTKTELSNELESVLKAAISTPVSSKEYVSSEITLTICNVIEAVFIHGLRDPFFLKGSRYAKYPEPNFWPFVSKYSHRGITNQIRNLNQIKTEIGRSRAWIRIVLNERSLEHYVDLLLSEKKALSQFYNEYAFLKDCERIERLKGILKGLSLLSLNAATNSSFLNSWTPSPLILAGLVSGKPIKSSAILIRRSSKDSEEVGTNALDILSGNISPNRIPNRKVSDDDVSSTYSHPSLLDKNDDAIISSTPRSESSFTRGSPDTTHQPLFVHRRTACPRKPSIGSSASNPRMSLYMKESGDSSTRNSSPTENVIDVPIRSDVDSRDRFLASSLPNLPQDVLLGNLLATTLENRAEQTKQALTAPIEIEPEEQLHKAAKRSAYDAVFGSETPPPPLPFVFDPSLIYEPTTEQDEIEEEKNNEDLPKSEKIEAKQVSFYGPDEDIPYSPTKEEEIPFSPKDEPPSFGLHQDVGNSASPAQIDCDESATLGTSLLDELTNAIPFNSHDDSACSNTLMGKGWAVARSVESESNCLSSSSSTDCSIGVVSFGQALRSALEQESPVIEDRDLLSKASSNEHQDSDSDKGERGVVDVLTMIPFEIGLPAQEFRCALCRKSIGPQFGYAKYGCCAMDGLYYCIDCLSPGGSSSIPSRVIQSWDWSKRDVSQKGRAFLNLHNDNAIINLVDHNDGLYDHCPCLQSVKDLRVRLSLAARYLFTCRPTIADELRKKIEPRDYIYNDIHLYSFSDLEAVKSGTLERQLSNWLKFAIGHVLACTTCKQKGFICEICNAKEVIYPFNTSNTHRCSECYSLFHLECIQAECPKCTRRARYETSRDASDLPLD